MNYFVFALRNLKRKGIRSWLTLLGIFVGVMAVVALISLGNALQVAVTSQFGIAQTEIITIQASGIAFGPPGAGAVTSLEVEDVEAIEKLGNVERAVRRNFGSGKLEYNDMVVFGTAVNIPSGSNRDFIYEQVGNKVEVGRLLDDDDVGKVFLGHNFYVNKVGLEKEVIPGKTVNIEGKDFEVVGILAKQGSFIFDNVVYMNDRDMQDLFGYEDTVNAIVAQPKDADEIDKVKEDIEKLMRKRRDVKVGEEDFEVSTPEASLESVNSILGGVKIFIALVAGISIFIGAIGIVNTMTTSVLERKREIGIMKAIGARNSQIFMQFFVESGMLGLVGGAIGVIFGVAFGFFGTLGINNFVGGDIKPTIDIGLIFFSLLGSFLIGGIAGIVPAMHAAKQNPVEALRG
jgi:putative ABC transport system permease protein